MNFLAHFFLARENPAWVAGNFLADYLQKPQQADLPAEVREGVALHIEIDRITDSHPVVREQVRLLQPSHGKYAPVILDVLFDYHLLHNWSRYSTEPFTEFEEAAYRALGSYQHVMPSDLQARLPRMLCSGWLRSYGTQEGLEFAVSRLQHRASRPEWLHGVTHTHTRHEQALNEGFNLFFPQMIEATQRWKAALALEEKRNGEGSGQDLIEHGGLR